MPHTPISQNIVSLLQQHHLLTAPQLLDKIHAQGQHANKTTVYRALDKLLAKGELCKHNLLANDIVYELRGHHHDHLVCENCGLIKVVSCQLDTPSLIEGFTITHHHVTFFGRCTDCQS